MNKHRYAIRLSDREAIKLYEKDIEKLQKQTDLLTLGLLQEKNKVTTLQNTIKSVAEKLRKQRIHPLDILPIENPQRLAKELEVAIANAES